MDTFTWIILLALGACLVMHLFGHGHGETHGHGDRARSATRDRGEPDRDPSGEDPGHATGRGHRHGRSGCC